jgi:hypothetical protein
MKQAVFCILEILSERTMGIDVKLCAYCMECNVYVCCPGFIRKGTVLCRLSSQYRCSP